MISRVGGRGALSTTTASAISRLPGPSPIKVRARAQDGVCAISAARPQTATFLDIETSYQL